MQEEPARTGKVTRPASAEEAEAAGKAKAAAKSAPAARSKAPAKSAPAARSKAPAKSAPAARSKAPAKSAPAARSKAPAKSAPAGKAKAAAKSAPAARAKAPAKSAPAARARKAGHHGRFATAINCMDGRVQLPVINWIMENLSVDYVDMITEPGPDRLLAEGEGAALDSIKARCLISVGKHGSDTILMVSHCDCAGNPVPRARHERQLRQSIACIQSWKLPVKRILGAWIGDDWKVVIVEPSG